MKLAGLSFLFAICLSLPARADLTIVQKVETAGKSGDATVKIKGDKERIDSPSQPTRIIDGKSGEMTALMNDRKTFVRISAQQMKAADETINKFEGDKQTSAKPKLTPSGKKETIGGYETEEYVYQTPRFKASFWIATKYPDSAAILKQMQTPMSGAWKQSNMGMPDYTDFPGLPLKTVISLGATQVATTIIAIKQEALSDAEFTVPKDFQEMKPPARGMPAPSESRPPPASSPTP
jgi:Domain of unknown function (DUF4412)